MLTVLVSGCGAGSEVSGARAVEDRRVYAMMARCVENAAAYLYADDWDDLNGGAEIDQAVGCMERRIGQMTQTGRVSAGWGCYTPGLKGQDGVFNAFDYHGGGCWKDDTGFTYTDVEFGFGLLGQ